MLARLFAAAMMTLCTGTACAGERLLTLSYDLTLESRCKEGMVGCKDMRLAAIDRKTGRSFLLRGREVHRMCADAVTPCAYLHSEFRRGNTTFLVLADGRGIIVRGRKVLLEEQGEWQ